GLPVIDHDIYGLDFGLYKGNPDVVTVKTRQEFDAHIEEIRADKNYIAALQAGLQNRKSRYGMLDGRCVDRIEALVASFITPPSISRKKRNENVILASEHRRKNPD